MCLPLKPYRIEREWEHAGLKCAAVLNREGGFRCGYVRVPPTHPLHGKHYDEADASLNVHGGLTFVQEESCAHEDGIGWWFGFDCAHAGDAMHDPDPDWNSLSPEAREELGFMRKIHIDVTAEMKLKFAGYVAGGEREEHYWLQPEVERECESLAEQLAAWKPPTEECAEASA